MQPWCGREAPPLTSLGPTCKRVDMLKAELDKVIPRMHMAQYSQDYSHMAGEISCMTFDQPAECASNHTQVAFTFTLKTL